MRIRELRVKKGWSVDRLAKESKVCRETIIALENQACSVTTTKTVLAISRALGVSIGELFL